jgi:hypothetical protein
LLVYFVFVNHLLREHNGLLFTSQTPTTQRENGANHTTQSPAYMALADDRWRGHKYGWFMERYEEWEWARPRSLLATQAFLEGFARKRHFVNMSQQNWADLLAQSFYGLPKASADMFHQLHEWDDVLVRRCTVGRPASPDSDGAVDHGADKDEVPQCPPLDTVTMASMIFDRTITWFDVDKVMARIRRKFPALQHLFIAQKWHDADMEVKDPAHERPNEYERLIAGLRLRTLTLKCFYPLRQMPSIGIVRPECLRPGGLFFVFEGGEAIQVVRPGEPPVGDPDCRPYGVPE